MASTSLVATAMLLLLYWSTHHVSAQGPLTVDISINYDPPPDFTRTSHTEYRAASRVEVTCTASGGPGSGAYTYQWSSTCRDCPFLTSTSNQVNRGAVHSGDTGNHTCTAFRGGESANASIEFNVVGYGIHIFTGFSTGTTPAGSLPNNGLVIVSINTQGYRLRVFCRSDSMTEPVGELFGPNGMIVTTNEFFVIEHGLPGQISLVSSVTDETALTSNEHGVYTCRIPDSANIVRNINIGIYPPGFNVLPSINNSLVFTPRSSNSTLTCISTISIATTVTFTRDSDPPLTLRDGEEGIDSNGVTYQLAQTVTNRARSTYQNVLTINQPLADIMGSSFTCSVANTVGSSSNSVPLVILDGLVITTQPRDVLTRSGETEFLECEAMGSANISYQWQKLNDTLDVVGGSAFGSGDAYVDVENATNSILEFDPVMFGDEGLYRCVVSSESITLTSDMALLIVSPEGSVVVSPINETFNQGDNVTFTCSACGGPGKTFQWLRNGTELINETSEMFVIFGITFMDGDEYTCMVSNAAGNESISTFPFVRPEIILNPIDMSTSNGSFIMIVCDAEAFPPPEFQWVHVGGDIGSNIVGESTNMLVFSLVLFGDEGDYFCMATSNGISVMSDNATITVSPKGSVVASPSVIDAERNTSQTFTCSALGGPGNTFTWTRLSDGQNVSADPELQILVLDASDGSQYECLVGNEAGNETATVTLNVAVAIDTPPMATNVTTTEEFFLTCTTSGYPAPLISWTHNGTDIDENDIRINIIESNGDRYVMSALIVSGAMTNDSGEYACNATNTFSTAIGGPVTVLVQDTPEQPQNVIGVALNSTAIRLTWFEPHDNNAPIQGYRVMYSRPEFLNGSDVELTVPSEMAVVTGLHPGVTYNFTVIAFNEIGDSRESTVSMVTSQEEEPATPPRNVQVLALSSTEIMVTWEEVAMIDQNGIITDYEVEFEPLDFPADIFTDTINATNLSIVITNLEEFVNYNISVRAYTSVGPGPYSDPVTVRTFEDEPATPPQNVQATAISSTEIMVTWEEVRRLDQNSIITDYEILLEALDFPAEIPTDTITTTNLSIMIIDLEEFINYNISVRAMTNVGPGPYSDPVTVRTFEDEPAAPPQNVQATAISSTEIMVTWEELHGLDENGIITNYEVQFEPLQFTLMLASVNTTNLSVNITGLEEYVEYNISVRAYTSVGPGPYSDPVTERTLEDRPATPPQNVQANAASSTEIMVTWEEVLPIDQNGIITNYEVQYQPLQFMESLSTMFVNTTDMAVNLTNLQEYVEYNISVRAYTSVGFGPFSTEITERTFEDEPATPPQNVQTIVLSSTTIMVTWEEVPAIDENGIVITYEIEFMPLQFTETLVTCSINTTDLFIDITGLQEYVEYDISVRAYTIVGPSPFSVAVTNRTFEDEPATPPQNVQTSALSSTEIMVTWERVTALDENGIIINYEVQYEPLQFADMLGTASINITNLSVNIVELQEYVEYNISVRAYTSVGPGPYSDPVTQRTLEDVPAGFPQNVTTTTLSSTTIRVNWETIPAIDENGIIVTYEILYEPQETFNGEIMSNFSINTTDVSMLEMVLNGLQEFVDYNVTVRAYTSIGFGPFNPTGDSSRTFEDVPVVAPDNLVVENISANELEVSWERPTEIDINGILRYYIIEYFIVDQSDTLLMVNVTGNVLNTVLNDLDNFTVYSVSVAAFTVDAGPSSTETERTSENVPGEPPQNVMAMNESSTTISVEWESPPQDFLFGILRGYTIRYLPGDMNMVNLTERIPPTTNSFTLENLCEFTNYSIEVTAVTGAGEGPYSPPVYVVTNQDLPGEVDLPREVRSNDFDDAFVNGVIDVTVRWNPPGDPNGVITRYNVEFVAISTNFPADPNSQRRKRQTNPVQQECIMGGADNVNRSTSVPGNQTSANLAGLTASTTYEFRVQAETEIGLGSFSEPRSFCTPEFVPTEPRDLTVQYLSSSSLEITWNHPLCDYGARTNYTVIHVPLNGTVGPLGEVGIPDSPAVLDEQVTSLTITGLTPNTNYSIEVYASTSAGAGNSSIEVNQTDEDIPQVVTNLNIVSVDNDNPDFRNNVVVRMTWTAPSLRNGSFDYNLTYTAAQTGNFPELRRNTAQDSMIVPGNMEEFTIEDALPFADYTFTIFAFNIKLNAPGDPETEANRSVAIDPTAVTNLQGIPNSFSSIRVTWSIPDFPNGPVDRYAVYYRNTSVVQEAPIESEGYYSLIKTVAANDSDFELVINNLVVFTFYAIHVQPLIGGGNGLEADFFGDIDLEISQRTNSTTTEQPTVNVPGPVSMLLWDPRSDSSVMVSWSPSLTPNGIILEYTIILLELNAVAGFADAQTVSNSTFMVEFTSSELEAGIPYSLTAFAVTTAGSGELTTITNFTRELTPPAPGGVTVDRTSGTQMTVSWTPLTLVEARSLIQFYQVFYSPGGSIRKRQSETICFQSPCDVPGTENSVLVMGLDSTISYSVSVAAVNGQDQQGELSETQTAPATATTSDNTAVIIGGVVAVVALLVIGVTVIVTVVIVLRYRNRRAEYIIKKHDSYESIELSGVTRSGDLNIDVKENVAYSVHGHHSRGSLPSPLIVVNPLAEGSVPQLQEGVYETIPGENEPDISPLDASYELISNC